MRCSNIELLLPGYSDGDLSADEAALVEQHLRSCSRCPALLSALGRSDALLRRLPTVPADLHPALAAARGPLPHMPLHTARPRTEGVFSREILGRGAVALSLTAVLLLAGAAALLLGLNPGRGTPVGGRPAGCTAGSSTGCTAVSRPVPVSITVISGGQQVQVTARSELYPDYSNRVRAVLESMTGETAACVGCADDQARRLRPAGDAVEVVYPQPGLELPYGPRYTRALIPLDGSVQDGERLLVLLGTDSGYQWMAPADSGAISALRAYALGGPLIQQPGQPVQPAVPSERATTPEPGVVVPIGGSEGPPKSTATAWEAARTGKRTPRAPRGASTKERERVYKLVGDFLYAARLYLRAEPGSEPAARYNEQARSYLTADYSTIVTDLRDLDIPEMGAPGPVSRLEYPVSLDLGPDYAIYVLGYPARGGSRTQRFVLDRSTGDWRIAAVNAPQWVVSPRAVSTASP